MKIFLGVMNILGFVLFGIDKWKAVHQKWRIRESVLLGVSACGGCFGALIGMYVFHHKTKKNKFRILVPLFCILWVWLLYRYLITVN